SLPGLRVLALSERGVADCLVLNPPVRRRLAGNARLRRCESGSDCLQLAMAHGALGTVRRSAEPAALFRALRAVASGQTSFEPRTACGRGPETDGFPELSARELDVAALVGEGRSNKEISVTLSISQATVKKHVSQILRKLSLQDRLQVGLFVARHPLLFSGDGG
ncbi:MAG TPA: response regulator transcription factor, partial [Terriglobales bacterium]|nr:response regulator transcription factor [Terriglobales bacterium]